MVCTVASCTVLHLCRLMQASCFGLSGPVLLLARKKNAQPRQVSISTVIALLFHFGGTSGCLGAV